MQIALTVWEGRISPLFDVSRMLLILQVEAGRVVGQCYSPYRSASIYSRAARLADLGVDCLICGGISRFCAEAIASYGIRIIPFAEGAVEEVLEACLDDLIGHGATTIQMNGSAAAPNRGNASRLMPKEDQQMRIAISAGGTTLDDSVEPRFGRCPYFIFVDPESMAYEAMPNPNIALGGGAGPQSAQLMAEKGVAAVLTGNCGPNAFQTFGAAGIDVITGIGGSVREALEKYKSGQLKKSGSPTVKNHYGMGGGMGMGGGRGMGGGGRGMGGGGRGMGGGGMMRPAMVGAGPAPDGATDMGAPAEAGTPKDAEITQLKKTVEDLRRQLDEVRKRP